MTAHALRDWTPETPLDWQALAACQWTDLDLMFPEQGGDVTAAKRVCRGCPVREQCLEYALENDERFGVWGGLSERERRRAKPRVVRDPAYCHSGRHLRTEADTGSSGRCLACNREGEAERAARARGASPRSGRGLAA